MTTLQTHSLEMLFGWLVGWLVCLFVCLFVGVVVVVVVVVFLLVVCDSKLRHRGWRPTAEDETSY